jgi:tetratricopeptide (TPR) repeat protein
MSNNETKSSAELLKEAQLAVNRRQLASAETLLTRVLDDDPDNLQALDLMGFVLFFQKKYGESEACCREALRVKPGHVYALNGLGLSLARQGKLDAGIEMLEKAMAADPSWPEPYWDMAVVLIEAEQRERAVQVLEMGISRIPESRNRFETLLRKIR